MKVLVVEPSLELRQRLSREAERRGHEVIACSTAEEASRLYEEDPAPLVLIADDLSGGGGLELCGRIRERAATEVGVIVVLTEAVEADAVEAALDAGADDYLVKPWNDSQLRLRLTVAERRVADREARRRSEQDLVYDALHDALTDLVKPTVLVERLERAARGASRRRGRFFAVLSLQLDDFESRVEPGNRSRVIVEVSRVLEDCVRSIDTVARSGEDEFAILLDDLRDVSDPTRVASRIHQALSQPVRLGGEEAFLSMSIGIALSATGFQAASELLDNAKEAMLLARGQGPGHHQMYDPVLNARVAARVGLESRLRRAVEREELAVHYQPIVKVADASILGFEALLAWNDGEHGEIAPSTFVPVAEDTGLIHRLGWWVFRRACRQLGEWRRDYPRERPLTMSVNVSGRQFADADVLTRVDELLAEAGLDGSGVHVEITESTLMDNVQEAQQVLLRLKERAVDLHVDDFGTGYSSLSYLCRFPIDALKIDRSFIGQMTSSPENLEIVRTIVRLAGNLGMRAIAEGVESQAQLDVLRKLGCEAAQGYLFSRPLPAEEASALLK